MTAAVIIGCAGIVVGGLLIDIGLLCIASELKLLKRAIKDRISVRIACPEAAQAAEEIRTVHIALSSLRGEVTTTNRKLEAMTSVLRK